MENIYVSLEEAREELKKRWNNADLKEEIEAELGDKLLCELKNGPRAMLWRQICPADNGFIFFFHCAKFIGIEPIIFENTNDIFVSFNEEKKGLGRLRVVLKNKKKAIIDIMHFHENEKKKLGECVLKNGEKLVDFHHNLFKILHYKVESFDNSKWFCNIGSATDYYYYLLLHSVVHGVLFERFIFSEENERENVFTNEVVLPALRRIKEKFGIKPLIVCLYPENQNAEEDFYWWCYPPHANDYIVNYAIKNNFVFKYLN